MPCSLICSKTYSAILLSKSKPPRFLLPSVARTSKLPFIQSRAHKAVYASSILLCITALIVPSTILGEAIGLVVLPTEYIGLIFGVTALYCVVALVAKKIYMSRNNGEWI